MTREGASRFLREHGGQVVFVALSIGMYALRRELVPPSGVEYATSLKLTPSTVFRSHSSNGDAPQAVTNLVVARSNTLRIYEVQEEDSLAFASSSGSGKDNWPKAKKDTEAVEGEAEIEGEGFVNLGLVKVIPFAYHFCRCSHYMQCLELYFASDCNEMLTTCLVFSVSASDLHNHKYDSTILSRARTPVTWNCDRPC